MATIVYKINDPAEYSQAGPQDLVQLLPVPGDHPLFLPKYIVEVVVGGIATQQFIHLSGPTGSCKTSLIQALCYVPDNFRAVATALGLEDKQPRIFPIEMATYESPGELWTRRALRDGATYDEPSAVVQAMLAAQKASGCYPVIWLREMGRVQAASVQGGLCDLVTKADILLPDGQRFDGRGISWICDSNYQAMESSTHTLVTFDNALKQRFSLNLTLDYLSPEQEAVVLERLAARFNWKTTDEALVIKLVRLGQDIRKQRSEGNLLSVPPPTIHGYVTFLHMAHTLPHLSIQAIAFTTMLGNSNADDRKVGMAVFNEVFGLQAEQDTGDPTKGGGLF